LAVLATAVLSAANLLAAPLGGCAIILMVWLLFVSDALIQQQGLHGDRRHLAQKLGQTKLGDLTGAKHHHGEGALWPSVVSTGLGPD